MRVNLPVSDTEYQIDEDTLILSTTDTKGRITFVNPTFTEVSGFSAEELIGKAHNIVRHPDMPPEAFEDLWITLKAGKPWTGLVKNRRKNGDHYWVLGHAAPIKENGKIVGYLSVRTKPARELIDTVAPIYRLFIEGKAKNLAIKKGKVVRTDFFGKFLNLFHMSTGRCLFLAAFIPSILLACIGGVSWWALTHEATSWLPGLIATATVSSIVVTVLFGIFSRNYILRPLRSIISFANILASGDLDASYASTRSDEFGELSQSINQLAKNLKATMRDILTCAQSVEQSISELADGNIDLSQRTERQAASLEETASSTEELTATVNKNSENFKQANELVLSSQDIAARGGNMMQEVITTMSSINTSSEKMTNIINVIDSIAFQTNILALNAAVEAARAGEQGRGFAVVASEVRGLAQKSAAAAKDIKGLIDESLKNVHSGSSHVNKAGQVIDEIVVAIKQISDIMSELTTASYEQQTGIEQVSRAISDIDEVTQQNAALVEQTAAVAKSLENQTKDLSGAISIFRLDSKNKNTASVTNLPHSKGPKKLPSNNAGARINSTRKRTATAGSNR